MKVLSLISTIALLVAATSAAPVPIPADNVAAALELEARAPMILAALGRGLSRVPGKAGKSAAKNQAESAMHVDPTHAKQIKNIVNKQFTDPKERKCWETALNKFAQYGGVNGQIGCRLLKQTDNVILKGVNARQMAMSAAMKQAQGKKAKVAKKSKKSKRSLEEYDESVERDLADDLEDRDLLEYVLDEVD